MLDKLYTALLKLGTFALAILALIFLGKRIGKVEAQRGAKEDDIETMQKYEDINSNPDVDDPFDRMRKKD